MSRQTKTVSLWLQRSGPETIAYCLKGATTEEFRDRLLSIFHPFDYRWPSDLLLHVALQEVDWAHVRQEVSCPPSGTSESVPTGKPAKA